ncbi:MAG: tRNA lysidine(34) synthetase TilS [Clostridia bacterium]|nr:tRNA lysidine(34) synthetase TilS [Clostridia bacterium]
MTAKVTSAIEKYNMLENGQTVIVGLSGGADSIALTHILLSLREKMSLNLIAAHVNHCIRGEEADRDERFVRDFCEKNSVTLKTLRFDVPAEAEKTGESEEECGRRIRYEFFDSLSDGNSVIATAHNFNDAVETFFINLTRGTGLKGLCSIPAKRGNIIRPLIECTRDEIEEYCEKNGLSFVTDSTNESTDYTRNKIRHGVIEEMKSINPSFFSLMQRTFENLQCDEKYLSSLASGFMTLYLEDGKIPADLLFAEPESVRNRVIVKMCSDAFSPLPDKKHIDLITEMLDNKKGGAVQLSGEYFAVSKNGEFFIEKKTETASPWETEITDFTKEIKTPAGVYGFEILSEKDLHTVQKNVLENAFDCDKINGKVFIRSRKDGDSIRPENRGVTKTLKKLFLEERIPVEDRNNIAVLSDENGVFLVENICVDERVKITDGTKNIIKLSKGE